MESTNQGVPLGGNPSPFSSWGEEEERAKGEKG